MKSNLSTVISAPVKSAVSQFCKSRGLKLSHFIEQALVESLEDQVDIEAFEQRRNEETIPLSKVLKSLKKSRRK